MSSTIFSAGTTLSENYKYVICYKSNRNLLNEEPLMVQVIARVKTGSEPILDLTPYAESVDPLRFRNIPQVK